MTILPQPKKLKRTGGTVSVANLKIVLTTKCDDRIFRAAQKLANEIYEETGITPVLTKSFTTPDVDGKIVIDCLGKKNGEGYKLSAKQNGIIITGDTLAGTFYGIQTLRQMLETCGEDIECCDIDDKPDMSYRGFYHDAARGRVPNLEGALKMVDFLAYYKHNSYQLYIEHNFEFDEYKGIYKAFGTLSAEEIMEIDNYCYENFIDFIPSLSTFGHLYRLLQSNKYKHLCELENFENHVHLWRNVMAHHTIDPTNPDSIKLICSLIDQYAPLFRTKYFNICCDETFDLTKGKNQGKDAGQLYVDFTLQIINHLKSHGKTVMMWGDIILHHPETLERFPSDTIMLNWNYAPDPALETVDKFKEANFNQIVCPGTSCWAQFCELIDIAEQNISKFVSKGAESKVMGMLNTAWGDYGAVCPITCTLYGVVLGAVVSWNHKTKVMCEKYDKQVSELVYGDPSGETVKLIRKLNECSNVLNWYSFIDVFFDGFYWWNWSEKRYLSEDSSIYSKNAENCFKIAEEFRRLPVQSEITNDLRLAAEGLGLINERAVRMIDKLPEPCDDRIENWCQRYTEAWLRNDKMDEVNVVCDVIRGRKVKIEDVLTLA